MEGGRGSGALASLLAAALLASSLAGCAFGGEERRQSAPGGEAVPHGGADQARDPDDPALDEALSEPVEDSFYPTVGDPGVDALHYQLDLAWTPDTTTLDAVETLLFRATTTAERFRLDLGEPLTVSELTVDGEEVDFDENGKDLVVEHAVEADRGYELRLRYSGTPAPVPAPTTRADFDEIGMRVTGTGEIWTMQEPYGAFTWYAVNDQPSDKAFYDFTISTPAPWVGVANGELVSRELVGDDTVSTWHLDEPASSYLTTLAVGDLVETRERSPGGVTLSYWTSRDDPTSRRRLRGSGELLGWLERRLGPYPYSTLGILVVDGTSGMETQTMITLGDLRWTLTRGVVLHELAHHWYGNQVTPRDWRDLWMSEGMAMYLQAIWTAGRGGPPLREQLDDWAAIATGLRDEAGPPADADPETFGQDNAYYIPALMWDQLRRRLGEDTFWRLVREWPATNAGNASYDEITAWWSEQTGEDLSGFFDAWLLGERSPAYP